MELFRGCVCSRRQMQEQIMHYSPLLCLAKMNYKQGLVIWVYVDSDLLRCVYVTQVADVISKLGLGYMDDG